MIIDTTISAMEDQMDKLRRLDEHVENKFRKKPGWHWPAERHARIQYRESAIRDFLIKQGKRPEQLLNYIAFWENGEIQAVHILTEPAEEARVRCVSYQKMLDKFASFMRFALRSNQRNQGPSKS